MLYLSNIISLTGTKFVSKDGYDTVYIFPELPQSLREAIPAHNNIVYFSLGMVEKTREMGVEFEGQSFIRHIKAMRDEYQMGLKEAKLLVQFSMFNETFKGVGDEIIYLQPRSIEPIPSEHGCRLLVTLGMQYNNPKVVGIAVTQSMGPDTRVLEKLFAFAQNDITDEGPWIMRKHPYMEVTSSTGSAVSVPSMSVGDTVTFYNNKLNTPVRTYICTGNDWRLLNRTLV